LSNALKNFEDKFLINKSNKNLRNSNQIVFQCFNL